MLPRISPSLSGLRDAKSCILLTVSATCFTFLVEMNGNFMSVSYGAMLYFVSRFVVSSDVTVLAFSTSGSATPFFRSLKRSAVACEL